MNAVRAIWTNGQILPSEPVNWPEGSELVVEPVDSIVKSQGLSETEWQDDPASVEAWANGVRSIETPKYSIEEEAEMARFREEYRQYNIEAVRRQMDTGDHQ